MQHRILHAVLFGLLGLLALGSWDRASPSPYPLPHDGGEGRVRGKPAKDQAPATTDVEAVLSVGMIVPDKDRADGDWRKPDGCPPVAEQ
jgi:hypothetical protein